MASHPEDRKYYPYISFKIPESFQLEKIPNNHEV